MTSPKSNPRSDKSNPASFDGTKARKVSHKYGDVNGKSANALYRSYKAWFRKTHPDKEPMRFIPWLKWAQSKGIVEIVETHSADGGFDVSMFREMLKGCDDVTLKAVQADLKTAKDGNWGSDSLQMLGISEMGTFGIDNSGDLDSAISAMNDEIKSRADVKVAPHGSKVKKIVAWSVVAVLAIGIGVAMATPSSK